MQTDGNLVIYQSGIGALWGAGTTGGYFRGFAVTMQDDGNLVLSSRGNARLGVSNTGNQPGAWMEMQNDGNLVVKKDGVALWASHTQIPPAPTPCGVISPGQGLGPGTSAFSCDGKTELRMQKDDGNLVLVWEGIALWSTKANINPNFVGFALWMQTDGNLVLFSLKSGGKMGISGTDQHPGAHLEIQGDGNLVVKLNNDLLWTSNTGGHS
jgi:hypothetical protein